MAQKYELKDGKILRDGVVIATRDAATGTLDYLPDMDKYRAPVSAFLRESGLDKPPVTPPEVAARQARVRQAGEAPDAPAATTPVEFTPEPQAAPAAEIAPEPARPVDTSREEELIAENNRLRALLAAQPTPWATAGTGMPQSVTLNVPNGNAIETARATQEQAVLNCYFAEGAPKLDPQLGDKTRAFVDWLYLNHPAEAEARYFGRRTHRQ